MANKNNGNKKIRVLYVLANYPQLSQTYVKNEIEALLSEFDLEIVALDGPDLNATTYQPYTSYKNYQPYCIQKNPSKILDKIKLFKPDVLHSHWLNMAPILHQLSKKSGVPYTIRTHSFDVLNEKNSYHVLSYLYNWYRGWPQFRGFKPEHVSKYINSGSCLGILAFPFVRDRLKDAGISSDKIIDCFPVVSFKQFFDQTPNGSGVMNMGACIPKKKMQDFIDLGNRLPERKFNLYSIGYQTPVIAKYNEDHGHPVNIVATVEPEMMHAEYKKHQWLVYTADKISNTVGWPMAVAEAQAAGVGVCLPNIRADLQDYLGGAGYLYDSIDQVENIIKNDVPEEIRSLGFEQARKSDIDAHKHLLTDLWIAHLAKR
jgi:hypothetical protein